MSSYVPVERMTDSQLEKRTVALRSVVQLVVDLGVENVNMKAVSQHSGVALGTLYRFFNSKDHLFASAIQEWQRPLVESRDPARHLPQSTMEERVLRYMQSGTRAYQRSPHLLGLLIYTTTSMDAFASQEMAEVRNRNVLGLSTRLAAIDEPARSLLVQLLEGSWWDLLVQWHAGRLTLTQIQERIEQSVHLLFGPEGPTWPSGRQTVEAAASRTGPPRS